MSGRVPSSLYIIVNCISVGFKLGWTRQDISRCHLGVWQLEFDILLTELANCAFPARKRQGFSFNLSLYTYMQYFEESLKDSILFIQLLNKKQNTVKYILCYNSWYSLLPVVLSCTLFLLYHHRRK